jgi:hypothetical protein
MHHGLAGTLSWACAAPWAKCPHAHRQDRQSRHRAPRTLIGFDARSEDAGQAESESVTVAERVRCTSVKFGFPNDEVLHGHRLYGAGLGYYQLHEVDNSAWLIELRAIEAFHDHAPEVPFENGHHFVLTFHDSTVEAIASDVRLVGSCGSRAEAVRRMTLLAGLD